MKMLKNEQSIKTHSKDFQTINQLSRLWLLTNKYSYQLNGNWPSCFIIQETSKYRHFKFRLWHEYFPFRNNNGQLNKEQMEKFCPTDLNYLCYQNCSKIILLPQTGLSQISHVNFKMWILKFETCGQILHI